MKAELERRPALLACLGLIAGILATDLLWVFLAAAALAFFLRNFKSAAILGGGVLTGILLSSTTMRAQSEPHPGYSQFVGYIVSVPANRLKGYSANLSSENGTYRMYWSDKVLSLGDQVRVRGKVFHLDPDFQNRKENGDILGRIIVQNGGVSVIQDGPFLFELGAQIREEFSKFSNHSLTGSAADIVPALTFNIDSLLQSEFREDLQRTGTIHIISASGVHVVMLVVAGMFILSALPISRTLQVIILIVALIVYASAAGFRPPIVRACIMSSLGLVAYFARREPDWISALALSLIAYLLFDPRSLYNVGFQLSFVTVGGLAMYLPDWDGNDRSTLGKRLLGAVRQTAMASLVATLASMPLIAYHFGQISLVSIPANLAIAPFVGPALVVSLGAFGVWFIVPSLANWMMGTVVAFFVSSLEWIIEQLAGLPFATVEVPEFSPYWLVIIYGALLMLWRPRVRSA